MNSLCSKRDLLIGIILSFCGNIIRHSKYIPDCINVSTSTLFENPIEVSNQFPQPFRILLGKFLSASKSRNKVFDRVPIRTLYQFLRPLLNIFILSLFFVFFDIAIHKIMLAVDTGFNIRLRE